MWRITIVLLFLQFTNTLQDPLKVSIYYESLCPDSVQFIVNQLHPAFQIIPNELNLDFVPYGKATHQYIDGKWHFECQHGRSECYGNKMQACALNEISDSIKREKFVHCIMASGNAASVSYIKKCVEQESASWEIVKQCGTSSRGDELLAQYGERTHNVDPLITFVPTIIFNDFYNNTVQTNCLYDFLYTACSALDTKPTGCPAKMKAPSIGGFRKWF